MGPVSLVRLLLRLSPPLPAAAAGREPPSDGPCGSGPHRAFDVWIGEREVRDGSGTMVGHDRIERAVSDCVLHEGWTGADGMQGESFDLHDPASGPCRRTRVDDTGRLHRLDAGARDGGDRRTTVFDGYDRPAAGARPP